MGAAPEPSGPTEPPAPRKKRRPFVLIFKIFAWFVAVVLFLLLAVFVFLQTTPGRELVRGIVVDALNGALKGRIEVDRIGGFLPFSAEIEGFRVHDPDGKLVISVARVTADFHPLDLLDRTIHLSNVLVERPEVVLFDDQNRIGMLEAFSPREVTPDTNDAPWLLAFEGIRLDQGTIERILPGTDSLTLSDLALDLTLGLGADGLKWPHLALRAKLGGDSPLVELAGGDLVLSTRGGFEGAKIRIDELELEAGGHGLSAVGTFDPSTEPHPTARLDLRDVHVDLERLPSSLREQLTVIPRGVPGHAAGGSAGAGGAVDGIAGAGHFDGTGRVELTSAGLATATFDASSPITLLSVQASADLTSGSQLGDWAATVRLLDIALPRRVAERLPGHTRSTRVDLRLLADGTGLPPGLAGDGGRVHVELDVLERHPGAPPGRLRLTVDRVADLDPSRGPFAPVYRAQAHIDEIGLQPWLQLAGEPKLVGAIDHLYLEARAALPEGEAPIVDALLSTELAAHGELSALTPPHPIEADRLEISGAMSWQGQGLPSARLDVRGVELGFAPGHVDSVRLGFELAQGAAGPEVVGSLVATGVRYEEISVGRVEVPLSLALGPTLDKGAIPTGRVRWNASDIVVGPRRIAATDGDLTVSREGRGLRVRGRVAHEGAGLGPTLAIGSSALALDVVLAPSGDLPVGGPITGSIDGTVSRVRSGPYRVGSVSLVDMKVDVPLGPRGLDGTIAAVGKAIVSDVAAPEGSAARVELDVDSRINLRTMNATGRARAEATHVIAYTSGAGPLGAKQRLAKVIIDAVAREDGRIAVTGSAVQPRSKDDNGVFAGPGDEAKPDESAATEAKPDESAATEAKPDESAAPAKPNGSTSTEAKPNGAIPRDEANLDIRFSGEVTLPSKRRPFAAQLDRLDVFRQGDLEPTVSLGPTRFVDGGWIEVDGLAIRTHRRTGVISASARFHPRDGTIELDLSFADLALPRWVELARDVMRWLDLDGPPPPSLPHEVTGKLALSLTVRGTLAAPVANLRLRGGDLRYGDARDGHIDVVASLADGHASLDASARWRGKSTVNVYAKAPVHLSLSPFSARWDDEVPLALELRARAPEIQQTLEAVASLVPGLSPPKVDGNLDMLVRVDGTPADPRLVTALMVDRLELASDWKNGRLTLEGTAREDSSGFRFELADEDNVRQAQIDIQLPFAIPAAVRQPDPIRWITSQLDNRPFKIEVVAPPFVVSESPLADILPVELADLAGQVDLRFAGTLIDPVVVGKVALRASESLPIALALDLSLDTSDDGSLGSRLTVTQPDGVSLLEGALNVPDLSRLLKSPDGIVEVSRDPRFTFELHTSEIRSLDLWELRQSLGQLFAQLFPDGWLMVDVAAKGGPDGPTARVYTRIRTSAPRGQAGFASTDPTAPRRNAADDVRVALSLGKEVALNVVMTQDTRALTPSLGLSVAVGLSMEQLLSGKIPAINDLPITRGRIVGGELRLEGFAGVFKSVLGTSSGTLTGDLQVSGTIGAPRFEGGLNAQFDRLVVAPIGLDQDNVTAALSFEEGTRWRLDVSELYAEKLTARTTTNYCNVVPRVIGDLDLTKKPYLTVALAGNIPRLAPKEMTLDGCIGMKDYPVLDTKSLTARIDGNLMLEGTVAEPSVRGELKVVDALLAPELASKSVRPIGLPLDVTLVRGDPVPPLERPVRNPYKTGIRLDVGVVLPADVVRVEPSLMQPYGEVRALLYPQGELRIRTVDGELSLVGTIEVPKDTVFLYGKTFTVDKDSRVVFTGDMANDPQLFFTARYNIAHIDLASIGLQTTRDSEVVVRVTGTPSEPRLEFTSSPAMDETNILSVIALGVPAGGGEALGDAVQSQLLTAVMGMATLQFARDFQQRLALDVLRIEARSADPTDTRLTAGKRLSEDLLLSYYLNLSAREGEDRQSGTLEYRLTRYLSLLARAGDSGDFGLEFNLRFADSPPAARTAPRRRERADNRPRKEPEPTNQQP